MKRFAQRRARRSAHVAQIGSDVARIAFRGVLATTVFGKQIGNAFEDPSTINYWVIGATIVVFAALTYGIGRWLTRKS